jgi:hypothetical protein
MFRMAGWSKGPLRARTYLQMHPQSRRQQVITTHLEEGLGGTPKRVKR